MRFLMFLLAGIGATWLLLYVTAGWTFNGAPTLILFAAFILSAHRRIRKVRA